MTASTKFHKRNPFTGEPNTKQKLVEVTEISIGRDPLPAGRTSGPGKYEPFFEKMVFKDSLTVPSTNVSRVGAALRNWLKKNDKPGVARSCQFYDHSESGKSQGRVWLLEK